MPMNEPLKQRLVGAGVLVALVVIFVPMLVDDPRETPAGVTALSQTPASTDRPNIRTIRNLGNRPDRSGQGGFSSRIIPVGEPEGDAGRATTAAAIATAAPAGESAGRSRPAESPAGGARLELAPSLELSPVAGTKDKSTGSRLGRGSGWAVQLGSFSNRQNAIALRDRLRAKGYPAFVMSTDNDRGAMTRVFVGPEPERARAAATIEKLERETNLRGMVVRVPRS